MFLLSQDELFLDIDPAKSLIRFPVSERRRRFGSDENSKIFRKTRIIDTVYNASNNELVRTKTSW